MRGGRNDDFTGQRENGTFHRHHQRDGRITAGLQGMIIPIAQALNDLMHAGVIAETRIGAKQKEKYPSIIFGRFSERMRRLITDSLGAPSLEINHCWVKVYGPVTQFRGANQSCIVSFGASAVRDNVDFAANVSPIGLRVGVPVENSYHDMDKFDVATFAVNSIARDQMPA